MNAAGESQDKANKEYVNDVLNSTSPTINKTDPYNISCNIHTSGNASFYLSDGSKYTNNNYFYTSASDQIYIEILNKACARWEEIITSGIAPVTLNGINIDDIRIEFGFSDSFSNSDILGCSFNARYYNSDKMPSTGCIIYNKDYFTVNPDEQLQNYFYNVVLHEIAHSLGYTDARWNELGIVETTTTPPANSYFTKVSGYPFAYYKGTNGVREFKKIYGSSAAFYNSSYNGFLLETITRGGVLWKSF